MSASVTIESEVKFVTPNNNLFYSALLYRPLESQRQEIRLLRLLPGQSSAQLRCEIVDNVFLSEHTRKYYALSYCAGDTTVVETTKVQNVDFNVFSNLGAGLRRIRKRDEPLLVWVDQICINQKDVSEREQQVLLMRSVYANAYKTILWLGEENQDQAEGLAVSFLQNLCERARTAQVSEYGDFQNALTQFFQILKERNPEMDVLNDTPTNPSNRTLIFNTELMADQGKILSNEFRDGKYGREIAATVVLYQMPWWKRCWVFQEAIVSKAADVLYGSSAIDFEALRVANAILTLAYRDQFSSISMDTIEEGSTQSLLVLLTEIINAKRLVDLEENWKTRHNLSIREVLNVSRQVESTDPRDRVYAVLGLIDQKYKIIPSYSPSNTTAQTFITAVKASIEHDRVLDILSDGHELGRNSNLGLPSWVPDFTVAPDHFSMCNWEHNEGKSLFNASLQADPGQSSRSGIPLPQFLPDKEGRTDHVLRCLMLDLGPLALENTIGDVPDLSSGAVDTSGQHYRDILMTAGLKDIYPSTYLENRDMSPDQPLEVALMQTLSCGVTPDGHITADISGANVEMGKTLFVDRYAQVHMVGAWRFFVTPKKVMGVAPAAARWDDTLCILMEAKVPFVLRKMSAEDSEAGDNDYILIGPAYLHGYMSGQAIMDIFGGRRGDTFSFVNIH